MKSYRTIALLVAFLVLGFVNATAQGKPASRTRAGDGGRCPLSGAYRIDLGASDKLYSVVKGATSSVPFGEQQRFFMDLSIRLTPPDLLAIECRGQEVSV